MNAGAVGSGPVNLPDPVGRPTDGAGAAAVGPPRAVNAGLSEDRIATFLQTLAKTQLSDLFGQIEQTRLAQDPALLQGLLRTAVAAVAAGDAPAAMSVLVKLVTLSPERGAQMVRDEAGLAPIRGDVSGLMRSLTVSAKLDAERTLAAAAALLETEQTRAAGAGGFDPHEVLAVAQRLMEAGQHVNYVRAGELGQIVIAYCQVPVTEIHASAPAKRRPAARRVAVRDRPFVPARVASRMRLAVRRLKTMGRRGPLLVLLLAWLAVGLAGGLVYYLAWGHRGQPPVDEILVEIWAGGFLALVAFQFFVRTRNIRF